MRTGGNGNGDVFPTRVGVNRGGGKMNMKARFVFPTRVGVNRRVTLALIGANSFPHPRGGEPPCARTSKKLCAFSPPAWG